MDIKKELIENLAQCMTKNPSVYAHQLLTLRYQLNDLQSNYDWLEAEMEMHRDSYEGMDASHRAELRDKHHTARRDYYENLRQLKAQYLES
tara:strand:+ start:109 stop:381 length:273 start_codon:yes stop_codon:yes gene_type:complete